MCNSNIIFLSFLAFQLPSPFDISRINTQLTYQSFQFRMEGMHYDTDDVDLRWEWEMWRVLSRLCPLWVDCRRITIATSFHQSQLGSMSPWDAMRVSSTAAAASSRSNQSSSRITDPRCLPTWRSFAAGLSRNTVVVASGLSAQSGLSTNPYQCAFRPMTICWRYFHTSIFTFESTGRPQNKAFPITLGPDFFCQKWTRYFRRRT